MKKENKTFIKYLGILAISCLTGGIMGVMSAMFDTDIRGVFEMLFKSLVKISPRLMFLNLAGLFIVYIKYKQGKELVKKTLRGDESAYDMADEKLEQAMEYTTYVTIYSLGILGIISSGFYGGYNMDYAVPVIAAIVEFVVSCVIFTFQQRSIVNRIKVLNPEKQGDVLDTKFQEKWFDSCDEAEKALIGKAAYESYKATSKAIVAVWVLLVFAGFLMPIGPLPTVAVTAIWFVQTYTYMKAARQK